MWEILVAHETVKFYMQAILRKEMAQESMTQND